MKAMQFKLHILALLLLLIPGTSLMGRQDELRPDTLSEGTVLPGGNIRAGTEATGARLFEQAIDLYEARQYEEALQLYRRFEESEGVSANLYYNMGNAAFRSHNIGYSILYYERALKLEPGHEDAAYNLQHVKRYREDVFEEVPEFFLRTWLSALSRSLNERAWSLVALAAFALSLVLLLFYLFSRSIILKKTSFFSSLVTLTLFIFTFWNALTAHKRLSEPAEGIIVSPSVVIRSTPSETGTDLFILHEGSRIEVQESLTDWQNIRIIDGREGWIRIGDFEYI